MELTLTDFVLYVVLGSFVIVPVIAMTSRFLHSRVEKRALENRVICRLCLLAFEDSSHVRTVDCPVCGATNEKGGRRRLR